MAPDHMRHRYTQLGRGPERRLVDQPPAVLRRAVPAVVPARRGRRARPRPPDRADRRRRCRSIRAPTCPPGYTADAAQPAGRLHRRPRRDGHVGDVVADAADRRPLAGRPRPVRPGVPDGHAPAGATTSSAPGCSPPSCAAHFEHGALPWRNAAISGWILDPDRKKMSKSKGNVVTPTALIEQYGTDAVRYWAASARPGVDTAFDEGQMKIGRKLANKLLNASQVRARLRASRRQARHAPPSRSTWRCSPASTTVVDEATARSRTTTTPAPSSAPSRSSGGSATTTSSSSRDARTAPRGAAPAASAQAALRTALRSLHRLFAPFLPFVADEVWCWWQTGLGPPRCVARRRRRRRRRCRPCSTRCRPCIGQIRRAKTDAKVSQRAGVDVRGGRHAADGCATLIEAADGDLADAGSVGRGSSTSTAVRSLATSRSPPAER